MNPMDRVTLHGLVVWAVFIACPLAGIAVARRLRERRKDRAWAASVAQSMKASRKPGPLLSAKDEAAFAFIVAHYNDVPLDEILDNDWEGL